ncbi:hypothetical protein P8452_77354 [Trifolium repens]|nr:hypothetical protein P8452_77354 [Trifolium repens]
MFGFSRRRTKLGRLKVQQLSDGTRSPVTVRHPKRIQNSILNGDGEEDVGDAVTGSSGHSHEIDNENACADISSCSSGGSENWVVLSISGDKPIPRFNHAAAVIGNKIIVVGGESATGLLDDVQVLNFDTFSWTTASSKLYLSPSSLPLKIPACKGHSLVSYGKKALLIGGKTDPGSDRISVWAFDTESECWSLMEAKGDIPVARNGHSVVRASSYLILFGGEDAKRRKLNDLHMFDLKSLTWLPLHYTGTAPSPRLNHVAALYDDKVLYVFGGSSKSKTLNDLYSLDFETMAWSRVKVRGFHPSPRAGCCGILCGTKWYITGGGSRKKRHGETLIFDIVKNEWSVTITSPPSSITTNKGFSLSHQIRWKCWNWIRMNQHLEDVQLPTKNLASAIEHGSGRKSLSESVDPNYHSTNVSLRKQFDRDEEYIADVKMDKNSNGSSLPLVADHITNENDRGKLMNINGAKVNIEGQVLSGMSNQQNRVFENDALENDGVSFPENDKSGSLSSTNIYQYYESKVAALIRKNGMLEGQLAASTASREAAEKSLASVHKSRQEMEKKLADALKEIELLREKLAGLELAQEEANNLSNIVHSDNVRLEHDVAFLKAVLDDTQKELHSTRGVIQGERARAFQLQYEVFHLKQRLQSMENRTSTTPRKPFHVQ